MCIYLSLLQFCSLTHLTTDYHPHISACYKNWTENKLRYIKSLIQRNRVILENARIAQLVKKFRAFYGTWSFITVFTRFRHWNLSWDSDSSPHPNILHLRYIITFSHICLRLSRGLFHSSLSAKLRTHFSFSARVLHTALLPYSFIYWPRKQN
jgi:hypothetical protein